MSEYYGTPNNNMEIKNTALINENEEFKKNYKFEPKSNTNEIAIKVGSLIGFFGIFIIAFISFSFWYVLMLWNGFDLYYFTYMTLIYISPIIAFILIGLEKENKVKFIKDEINNTLIVKVINAFCFTKKTLTYNLQNVAINLIEKLVHSEEDGDSIERYLVLSNTFKYNFDFDLNKIKEKPIDNIFYVMKEFKNIHESYSYLKDFLNCSPENESPVLFNINEYMGKSNLPSPTFIYNLSRYMKMSEHFFSFYTHEICCNVHMSKLVFIQVLTYLSLFVILFTVMPIKEYIKMPPLILYH